MMPQRATASRTWAVVRQPASAAAASKTSRLVVRAHDNNSTTDEPHVSSEDDQPEIVSPHKVSSMYFPRLVQNLLWNAASVRDRGRTSCAVCKATGMVPCPACQGERVLTRSALSARKHRAEVRDASQFTASQTKSARGGMITNRCSQCHGRGVVPCPTCDGAGFLHE